MFKRPVFWVLRINTVILVLLFMVMLFGVVNGYVEMKNVAFGFVVFPFLAIFSEIVLRGLKKTGEQRRFWHFIATGYFVGQIILAYFVFTNIEKFNNQDLILPAAYLLLTAILSLIWLARNKGS